MLRLLAATVIYAGLMAGASAQEFSGVLEQGDQEAEGGGYADGYEFQASQGDEFRFAISGMNAIPHAVIFDSDMKIDYSTFGSSGELAVNWKAKSSGRYTFFVSQRYKEETPYRLVISPLPAGTVLD